MNALTSITCSYLLPITRARAIDIYKPNKNHDRVRNFVYNKNNIHKDDIQQFIDKNSILISVHPCKELASSVIDIFKISDAKFLCMMPGCRGQIKKVPYSIQKKLGYYVSWCTDLYYRLDNASLVFENACLSPCNGIIIAKNSLKSL